MYSAHIAEQDVKQITDNYGAHIAEQDNVCPMYVSVLWGKYSPSDLVLTIEGTKQKNIIFPSLSILMRDENVKMCTAENIASSGRKY